jgi:hypothetical protein
VKTFEELRALLDAAPVPRNRQVWTPDGIRYSIDGQEVTHAEYFLSSYSVPSPKLADMTASKRLKR